MKNFGQAKAGLQLLLIAIELHPKAANLFDSAADFYSNAKQNNKALEYYRKALEIDPNYPNAKKARDFIGERQK